MSITAADQLDWRSSNWPILHLGGKGPALARIVPDHSTGLWRISHDGKLSDIVNASRATDAAISLACLAKSTAGKVGGPAHALFPPGWPITPLRLF